MKLYNQSRKNAISERVVLADSSWKRFWGLMGEKKERFDYALVMEMPLESKWGSSIHMLFMKFSIGAIFLDQNKTVVDKVALKPWALNYTPKKAAKFVVELPEKAGESVSLGDVLQWK